MLTLDNDTFEVSEGSNYNKSRFRNPVLLFCGPIWEICSMLCKPLYKRLFLCMGVVVPFIRVVTCHEGGHA